MGRAFVQPKYQSIQGGKKSLFALDNLWDGIGAVIANIPDLKYLIGKVTIYSTTEIRAASSLSSSANNSTALSPATSQTKAAIP